MSPEDLDHLFGTFTCKFWNNFSDFIINMLTLILFFLFSCESKLILIINLILILSKCHIHKFKFSNKKASFLVSEFDCKHYIKTVVV